MRKYLKLLSSKTKVKCLGITLLAFASSYLASAWPVRLSNIYTDVVNGKIHDLSTAMRAVIIFGGIYLAAEVITITRRVLLDRTIATHEAELREWSVEKLLKMPVAYYTGGLSAERTAQLNQAVAGFSHLLKICCNDIFSTTLIALCTLLQVAVKVPALITVTVALYLVFSILISVLQIRSQNGIRERIIGQKNALDGLICQSIMNLELIRSLNACSYEKSRLRPDILLISRTEKTHHKYMGFYDCCKQTCKIVFQILVILLSVVLVTKGRMTTVDVVAVSLLFQQLVKPLDEVYRVMDEASAALICRAGLATGDQLVIILFIPHIHHMIGGNQFPLRSFVCLRNSVSSRLEHGAECFILQSRLRNATNIPCGSIGFFIMKTVNISIMRSLTTKFRCLIVHHLQKCIDTSTYMYCHYHCRVRSRCYHYTVKKVFKGDLLTGFQIHTQNADRHLVQHAAGHRDHLIQIAVFQGHQRGHHLDHACRIDLPIRIPCIEHGSAVQLIEYCRLRSLYHFFFLTKGHGRIHAVAAVGHRRFTGCGKSGYA